MLIIFAFAIYTLVKRKVYITRNWTLTGTNARNYGLAVMILYFPVMLISRALLPSLLPEALLQHPIGGRLTMLAVLAAVMLLLALAFEDERPAPVNW